MPLIELRDLLQFPSGNNETDTLINGVHLNRTALELYNYILYSNNTISNASKCYLIFDNYQPTLLSNGSWINGTSCYGPYYGIATRGYLDIALGTAFGISIMFTLMNLRKHGRMFIREDKRFRIIGRRWQWYWMTFVAACGMISTLTGVDVDRDYVQSLAIVLQSFFFTLMVPGALAMVWEATRHWGSWQERQICERDPYLLPQDDRRAQTEFYLPLVFYLFAWLNFFMAIPRSWGKLSLQRSPDQEAAIAEPNGTDNRLKAASILAVCAWFVTIYSLSHSLYHYKPQASTIGNKISNFCRDTPLKLFASLIVLAIRLGYGIASAWEWNLTILKVTVNPAWPFSLGYGTCLIIIIIFNVAGWIEENEDKRILALRRDLGRAHDAELGIIKKPSWWNRAMAGIYASPEDRLKNMTSEVGGGRPTTRNISTNIELGNMGNSTMRDRSKSRPKGDPFRDPSPSSSIAPSVTAGAGPAYNVRTESGQPMLRPDAHRMESDAASTVTAATDATRMTGATLHPDMPPQRIRSMLDV